MATDGFWNQPDVVERFAAREPDHRLAELAPALAAELGGAGAVAILDLGCAAGRNTVYLAERGFDVRAVDSAGAMVERTRARLSPIVGAEEAARRVRRGSMDDLSAFANGSFDLVIALGIFHNASSPDEWYRAAGEAVRVLGPGGRLLVAHFTPETDLTGKGIEPVPGVDNLYSGFHSGYAVLLDAEALDRGFAALGLEPEVASDTVRVEMEVGRRVVVNALYRKPGSLDLS